MSLLRILLNPPPAKIVIEYADGMKDIADSQREAQMIVINRTWRSNKTICAELRPQTYWERVKSAAKGQP